MAPLSAPHQGRARAILSAGVLFLVLPYVFVALRIWARRLKKSSLCFNDHIIFLALIFTTGFNINSIISSIKGGYGQHIYRLSLGELEVSAKSIVVSTLLWPTANTLVKISVLHFYKVIFRNQKMVYAIYAVGTITLAYWLATVITAFSICQPFEYNWNQTTVSGHCGNLLAYYLSTGIVNLIIDVMIIALPLPILWGLQMKTSKKISLTAIFSLGAGICVISIVRCVAITNLNTQDETYSVVLDNICTSLEPTLGVINACLPILHPVVSKVPGSPVFTWLKSLRSTKTSARRLRSMQIKQYSSDYNSDNFRRLPGDIYPLTEVTSTQHSQNGGAGRGFGKE